MSDRARVALTLAVLSIELAMLVNSLSGGRAGEWVIYKARVAHWRLTAPYRAEQRTRREAGRVIWEAIETTREAADNDL